MQGGPALAAGSVFAKDFRVERPLAAGGMGAVYVVEQLSTGRKRALKLMHADYVHDDDARRRFVLEARVGARIESEHVVEVQAAGVDEATGAPYLVMELLEGEDLASRLKREGQMAALDVHDLFRQMCHAVARAHAAGIVHRDLKPQNIFLAEHRRVDELGFHVKVLDFGIAKLTTETGSRTGVIGTPLWMAPEQGEHGRVTPAADVWSLGLILYKVLTGRDFWRSGNVEGGASIQQILREMLFDRLPSPIERAREQGVADRFPPFLEPIFTSSVVRDVDARFPDAGAFWDALDQALTRGAAHPHPIVRRLGAAAGAGTAFEQTAFDLDSAPSLELAYEPGHLRSAPPAPPASAPTRGASAGAVATRAPMLAPLVPPLSQPSRSSRPSHRPLLAEPRWSPPSWLFVVISVGLAIGAVVVAKRKLDGPNGNKASAVCRLCTIPEKTHANGLVPLATVRNRIEGIFPELESQCLPKATGPTELTLTFTVEDTGGIVQRVPPPRASVSDPAARCVLERVRNIQFGILALARPRLAGATDVTYTLEYDPSLTR